MPRGSKDKYTVAQKRKAAAIESSYEDRGIAEDEARVLDADVASPQAAGEGQPAERCIGVSTAQRDGEAETVLDDPRFARPLRLPARQTILVIP